MDGDLETADSMPARRLDLPTKLRQAALVEPLRQFASGETVAAPVVVELDPTTFCDLACPECISGGILNRGRFSSARLLELMNEFLDIGVRAVILIGGGEPLMHPVISEVIARLATGGIKVGITTNGTQLGRHMDAVARHAAWTRVSVDAASPQTYARFRPGRRGHNAFSQVIANMRDLASRKQGALGYSYLLMTRYGDSGLILDSNFGDVLAAARLAADIGCDYFEVKPEYDMEHNLIRQDPNLLVQLADLLHQADALRSPTFDVIYPDHLWRVIADGPLDQPKHYDRCPVSELRTLITPHAAYICPYHRGNDQAAYGDPTIVPFGELWRGAQRKVAIQEIKPSVHCRFNCIRDESNRNLIAMVKSGLRVLPDTLPDYDLFI